MLNLDAGLSFLGKEPHGKQTHSVVGVDRDSQARNPLGLTVRTAAGESLQIVAKNGAQKQRWVDALHQTVEMHKLAGSRAVKHQATGWERLTRRLLRRDRRRDKARVYKEYYPGTDEPPQARRRYRQLERERRLAEERADDLERMLKEAEARAVDERRRRQDVSASVAEELDDRTAEIQRDADRSAQRRLVSSIPQARALDPPRTRPATQVSSPRTTTHPMDASERLHAITEPSAAVAPPPRLRRAARCRRELHRRLLRRRGLFLVKR